jgi:6-phosphogluconate dehydrogenase
MDKGENTIIYVMGVSGSGKSTVGKALSLQLDIPFVDGDDFHPPENVAKMSAGQPLDDEDRRGWLREIQAFAKKQLQREGVVIACSALKQEYREQLMAGIESQVKWVYLQGDFELILQRMRAREGHFMPEALLQSQFDILEEPAQAIKVSIIHAPELIVKKILPQLT